MKNYSFADIERIIYEQAEQDFKKKMATKRTGNKERKPRVKR